MKVDKLNHILIVSGTHGNELSGVYIHKLINEQHYAAERSTFKASSVIANKAAVTNNVRYIETDLNREFAITGENSSSHLLESSLARQFVNKYGQKSQLIIDLHNTTSNMGATLILLSNHIFYQKMGAYVKQQMPEAHILFEDKKPWPAQPYLCTAGEYGVMIEVGEQAHGALKYSTFELMSQMLTTVLDYVEKYNLKQTETLSDYSAFYFTEELKIPLDKNGLREAMVHPNVCENDFGVVRSGEPLLITFKGQDICWQGAGEIYPHFINESAYSKENIAMALAEKRSVSLK